MGAMLRGSQRVLALDVQVPVGTYSSPEFWIADETPGLLVTVDVTDINGATITEVHIQKKSGANFDNIAAFTAQAITANGRYIYRIAPGAARAAGANAYKGVAEDVAPRTGRVNIVNTVAIPTLTVRVEAVG